MRPDYLADVRVGKLTIERLKNFVRASGTCTKEELARATTKFALISLAEAKSVDLAELLSSIPSSSPMISSVRGRTQISVVHEYPEPAGALSHKPKQQYEAEPTAHANVAASQAEATLAAARATARSEARAMATAATAAADAEAAQERLAGEEQASLAATSGRLSAVRAADKAGVIHAEETTRVRAAAAARNQLLRQQSRQLQESTRLRRQQEKEAAAAGQLEVRPIHLITAGAQTIFGWLTDASRKWGTGEESSEMASEGPVVADAGRQEWIEAEARAALAREQAIAASAAAAQALAAAEVAAAAAMAKAAEEAADAHAADECDLLQQRMAKMAVLQALAAGRGEEMRIAAKGLTSTHAAARAEAAERLRVEAEQTVGRAAEITLPATLTSSEAAGPQGCSSSLTAATGGSPIAPKVRDPPLAQPTDKLSHARTRHVSVLKRGRPHVHRVFTRPSSVIWLLRSLRGAHRQRRKRM